MRTRQLCLVLLFSMLGQGYGQQPTFKSAVNLVAFTATITDANGRYVRDLQKENVAVFEDGARQQIADGDGHDE